MQGPERGDKEKPVCDKFNICIYINIISDSIEDLKYSNQLVMANQIEILCNNNHEPVYCRMSTKIIDCYVI